jgi:2-amino-4-hydroxy-6-hydroxymethyldihydropteridine diphosphokinase
MPPGEEIIYLSLGTNLGYRAVNLQAARQALAPAVIELAASPIYETEPWGFTDQPAFLNQVLRAATTLDPEALLDWLKAIEVQLGRQPSFHYGPRLIDLDILFYSSQVYASDRLTIPHPHLAERAFVLAPLADLAPELRHPVLKQTITEMLAAMDISGIHKVG